ncbi:MAG: CRTAC1 family protein [Terriglobia bacterium]
MIRNPSVRRLGRRELLKLLGVSLAPYACGFSAPAPSKSVSPIQFSLEPIPFTLENDETPIRHSPATMAGGVAVFDYNNDGRPDIFFTNGANIASLKKDSPKFSNRLFRNDGHGVFADVTQPAGLQGLGYDQGVAAGDYDNDGQVDLFVAGVHRNTLYHNNGNGTFTDVTARAGLGQWNDPEYGPLWGVTAVWVDVNSDGWLDLLVANYGQWNYQTEPPCGYGGKYDYCDPKFYKGLPNQLFLNQGDGSFKDVSAEWGIRSHIGRAMGVAMADYDLDGRPDVFVTNDKYYNFLFHNVGGKFEEVALQEGVALVADGNFISGMGVDFRDINNDGFPDIAFVALNNQTFPIFENDAGKMFEEITERSGMRELSRSMSGFGAGLFDFDNDGWKDLFVTRGHVESLPNAGWQVDQYNTVFRNLGPGGRWQALTAEAGLTAAPPARHRGCAFGDLDGDGRIDVVATALLRPAEIWMNRSEPAGNWLNVRLEGTKSNRDGIGAVVKVTTKAGAQYNHMTTSTGYASSSHAPVHFGLGTEQRAESIEIRWPSGIRQRLRNVAANRTITVKETGR